MILYNISVYIYIYVYIKNPRRFPKWWNQEIQEWSKGPSWSVSECQEIGEVGLEPATLEHDKQQNRTNCYNRWCCSFTCLGSVSPQVGDMSPFILHCGYNRDRSRPIVPCFGLDEDP